MTNLTTIQQLRANVQQIDLMKSQNHILLSQFVASDEFLDLLNETRLSANPIETSIINNSIQIKYQYKFISFTINLTDKEISDLNNQTIFKDKVSNRIKEIDKSLKNIENAAKLVMEKFDNDKK